MKAKIILTLSFFAAIAIMMGCTKQPYYDIPYDENGNVYITGISKVTADPVIVGQDSFTINCYFPNAKSGKSITVGSDFKTSVTYTLTEANLLNVGDAVTVVFSGATDSGIIRIVLQAAP